MATEQVGVQFSQFVIAPPASSDISKNTTRQAPRATACRREPHSTPSTYRKHSTVQSTSLAQSSKARTTCRPERDNAQQADRVAETRHVHIMSSSIYRAVLSKEAKHTYCYCNVSIYVHGALDICKSSVCT